MEEIKAPKKERKFLKAMGEVALTLVRELLLNAGKKLINKSGNKRQGLVLAFIIIASTFAIAQYPTTGNKQRLGYQTTGDGLVYRGRSNDTTTIKSSGLNNAYHIYDTINNVLYSYVKTKGGWVFNSTGTVIINNNFTQPVDSLFFNVGVSTNNVDTAKMRWDSDLATVVLGLNDNVPNELGFKNFWLVKNQTGSTITKGSLVYANGTVGASGRITVAKFIANGSIDAKHLLGITAHDLTDGEDGYVISFGKIRQVNTDTFAAGAILYPSPTVAGVWTDVEPVAPNIDMPIGFCINSSSNNGTIAIRVASGYKLSELHDVSITSPVDRASLYYRGGLWRDTTAALLTSDTASMLTNYLRTGTAAGTYLTQSNAASTYLPLTGGTLTGALNGTTGSFNTRLGVGSFAGSPTLFTSGSGDQEIHFTHSDNIQGRKVSLRLTNNNSGFYTYGGLIYALQGEGLNQYNRMSLGVNTTEIMHLTRFSRVGIMNNSPSYTLDVNGTFNATGNSLIGGTLGVTGGLTGTTGTFTGLNVNNTNVNGEGVLSLKSYNFNFANRIQFGDGAVIRKEITQNAESNMLFRTFAVGGGEGGYSFYTRRSPNAEILSLNIDRDGNSNFYGTLGVTGATTLSAPLTVNSSAVFNEGSAIADFRVESDGNANMLFVDGTNNRVGIGYASPTKTLDVNGEIRINTVTATPTSLLGKDGSNVVGNVRLTSPLSLAGDSLNLGTVPITKGGTGAESASVARTTLGVGYIFTEVTAGSSVTLSSNRASIVNTGGASTTQLDLTPATNGRMYMIKNLATGTVVSLHSNVIPLAGGSPTTAILSAGNVTPQWVTLVADGTNWHIMQRN